MITDVKEIMTILFIGTISHVAIFGTENRVLQQSRI